MCTARRVFLFGLLAGIAQMGCVGEVGLDGLAALLAPPSCSESYLADVESDFDVQVDLSTPGSSPQLVFDAFIPGSTAKILQTRQIQITLPAAFGFNGFGAPGASVGQLDFDFGSDRVFNLDPLADYTIPHRAIDADDAYADSLQNGSYDAGIDATATHTIGLGGAHVFTITMPSGATNFGGVCSYFDTSTRFTLPAGVVQLPAAPGSYDVAIDALSVDPDTGDITDNAGLPPIAYSRSEPVHVPEPDTAASLVAVAMLLALGGRRA